ncbi:hypothetical protein [Geodermatophilus sp. SYSU D00700]
MNRLTQLAAAAAVGAGLVLVAAPIASAAPPVGACPAPFSAADENEQLEIIRSLFEPGTSEEFLIQVREETLDRLDKNGDRTLCLLFQNRGSFNAIDNIAGGGNR